MEYRLRADFSKLRLFDVRHGPSRRKLAMESMSCLLGAHSVARAWTAVLMDPAAELDGVIYISTRGSLRRTPEICLALFDTPPTMAAIGGAHCSRGRTCAKNPRLYASLLAEEIQILTHP